MRLLATLVMVVLPLQGLTILVSSIAAPAHYHRPLPQASLVLLAMQTPHHHAAPADPDEPHEVESVEILGHALVGHADHHDHDSEIDDLLPTLVPDHHQDQATEASHHDAGIGHHSHGLEQADVVYVAGDPDRTDLGPGGNHVTAGLEAALPAASRSLQAMPGVQPLPDGISQFVSRDTEPLLRPPSAPGSSHA